MGRDDTVKLAIRSLLEVVQTGAKNIEIVVMSVDGTVTLDTAEVESITAIIEAENAAEVSLLFFARN